MWLHTAKSQEGCYYRRRHKRAFLYNYPLVISLFEEYFKWAFRIGKTILESPKGEDLLRRLIFNTRAEETPGRFLDRLSETLGEYRTNRNIELDVSMRSDFYDQTWFADGFYYLKSAILTGFLNALASERGSRKTDSEKKGTK